MAANNYRLINLILVWQPTFSDPSSLESQFGTFHVQVNHIWLLHKTGNVQLNFTAQEAVVILFVFITVLCVLWLFRRYELLRVRRNMEKLKENNVLAPQKEIQFFTETTLPPVHKSFSCVFGLLKNKQDFFHPDNQYLAGNEWNHFFDGKKNAVIERDSDKSAFCDFVCMVNQKCFFPASASDVKALNTLQIPVKVDDAFPELTSDHHENAFFRKKEITTSTVVDQFQSAETKPPELFMSPVDQEFLHKIGKIVEKNYADNNFSVEQMAFELNLSISQVNRKLRALTNYPSGLLLRVFRLHRAAGLIIAKADPISEICFNVGFNSQQYFCRAFKKQFGYSPSVFRRKVIEKSIFMRQ